MKKIILALVAASFILSGCGSTPVTSADVVAWLKTNCNAIVADAADVAALITANPLITTVAGFGDMICNAIKTQQAAAGNTPTASAGGVVIVNGLPIHYTLGK